jgi:hypothetical protein
MLPLEVSESTAAAKPAPTGKLFSKAGLPAAKSRPKAKSRHRP